MQWNYYVSISWEILITQEMNVTLQKLISEHLFWVISFGFLIFFLINYLFLLIYVLSNCDTFSLSNLKIQSQSYDQYLPAKR